MVIRNLCWSFGLLAAVCGACSSDPGAGNGYIDLPSVGPSSRGGSGAVSGVSGSTSIAGTGASVAVGGMSSVDAVLPSTGCSKPLPTGQTMGSYTKYTVHV